MCSALFYVSFVFFVAASQDLSKRLSARESEPEPRMFVVHHPFTCS
jgi:hypothetical protein